MKTINVAKDFTRFPAGRYRTDGPYSGELFREQFLAPALAEHPEISVVLDGAAGYGSSFLDEAFGGLVRTHIIESVNVRKRIKLESSDESLIDEIFGYMGSSPQG